VDEKTQLERERERALTVSYDQQLAGQRLLPAVVENVLGSIGGNAFHNFVGDEMEVWRQVSIATGPDVIPAEQILGKPFKLRNFYCHQIQIAGSTPGEYKDAKRCVLIDVDSKAYAFISDGVAADLARIISTFGMGPYTEGIPIVVKAFQTGNKRRAYTIQPA
jgi:hypothetical protein